MNKLIKMNDDEIKGLLDISLSISDFLRKVGYSTNTGGGYKILHRECQKRNIDISVYKSKFKLTLKDVIYPKIKRTPIDEILVENSTYENRARLKERLVREGRLDYKCVGCNNEGIWNNTKLSLQLNHKNGINNDNRVENLEFLCPNCHSQTENYAGKNKKNET